MMGRNICFNEDIWKIFPKLSPLPLPILNTGLCLISMPCSFQVALHIWPQKSTRQKIIWRPKDDGFYMKQLVLSVIFFVSFLLN